MAGKSLVESLQSSVRRAKKLSALEVGCTYCPLNRVRGVQKIMGNVEGREVFVWGIAPGPLENRGGMEFVGPSGCLLWCELKLVGIERSMCDVQNVVRCFPPTDDLKNRKPKREEIHCCSVYNQKAIERHRAKVHLVFGKVAAKSLLGAEYRQGKKSFWSDKLGANVMCMYHPSYFLRKGYGGKAARPLSAAYKQWRMDFHNAASLLCNQSYC